MLVGWSSLIRDAPVSMPRGQHFIFRDSIMKTHHRNGFICAALAVAGLLGAVAPVDAAPVLVRGRFNPEYGTPFTQPRLGWGGTIDLQYDSSCATPGGQISVLTCQSLQITDTSVGLFEFSGTDTEGPVLQIMDFGATAGILGLGWLLNFDNNAKLRSVRSTAFNALQGGIAATMYDKGTLDPLDDVQAYFSLQFLGDFAQLYWFDKEPLTNRFGVPDEVVLTAAAGNVGGICRQTGVNAVPGFVTPFVNPDYCGWSDPDNMSQGAFITFEVVPEPATYALVPAALGIMGLVAMTSRRRRLLTPQ